MPDWLTHVMFGLLLCEVFRIKYKSLVLIGSLLPDIPRLLPHLFGETYSSYWSLQPLHTPIGAILLSISVSSLFNKKAIVPLLLGVSSHFLLDLTIWRLGGGLLVFFPFSWKGYSLDLLWPEQFYIPLFFSLLFLFIYKFRARIR